VGAFWRTEMSSGYSGLLEGFYSHAIDYDARGEPTGNGVRRLLSPEDHVLDVLSARYVLLPDSPSMRDQVDRQSPPGLPSRFTVQPLGDETLMVVNGGALPRVRSVVQVVPRATRFESLAATRDRRASPQRTAFVDKEVTPDVTAGPRAECGVDALSERPGEI